ncbi:hypothetical protein EE612_043797 [Oryza sativa]|nr:hypothetical protein EE612_043797 [Oryza sativa]
MGGTILYPLDLDAVRRSGVHRGSYWRRRCSDRWRRSRPVRDQRGSHDRSGRHTAARVVAPATNPHHEIPARPPCRSSMKMAKTACVIMARDAENGIEDGNKGRHTFCSSLFL